MKKITTLLGVTGLFLVAGNSFAFDVEGTFKAKCGTCHMTGAAGAPMVGNKDQWAPRIAKGKDALYNTALTGSKVNPAMLPKGGFTDLSDDQVKAIVDYMVDKSK